MPIDQINLDLRSKALEAEIEGVNTRIARLAMALGAPLGSEDDVLRVLDRSAMPQEVVSPYAKDREITGDVKLDGRFSMADRRTDANHRKAYEWEELRGLLVLRYEMEKHYVEQMGLEVTRDILLTAEAHQAREGFKNHPDGLDLKTLLDSTK
jgi:hypothetical protein